MRQAIAWLVVVFGVAAASHDRQAAVVVFVSAFDVYRVDASGAVELEPTDSLSAHSALSSAAKQAIVEVMGLQLVPDPELTQSQQAVVDEHLALFEANARAAWQMLVTAKVDGNGDQAAYSVGAGLGFLVEQTGADKALILFGAKQYPTRARSALSVLTPDSVGDAWAGESSVLFGGVLDLRSGVIDWMWGQAPLTDDVRSSEPASDAVKRLLERYPESGLYRTGQP